MSLKSRIILQSVLTFAGAVALLFLPAGTWHFWQAWVYLAIVFVPNVIFFVYYYKHDPALLQRRMQTKEPVKAQKRIIRAVQLICIFATMLPGLDHRVGWTRRLMGGVPLWVEILALFLVLAGYLGTMWVADVNRFAARTVQVEQGQTVVSGGPYRVVRHPMYGFGLLMWMASAPALGSYVTWPFFALLIPTFVARLLNEEKVLLRDLPGYAAYCQGTRYHLVPYIW
jgi:protein-S-isoprenylcysteine O-methyltransferase Ste14